MYRIKIHEIEYAGVNYQIGYKVVTDGFKSTGLNGTPIVKFDESEWNVSKKHGIWVARVPSFATYIRSWLKHRYGKKSKTYIVALKNIQDVRKHGVKAESIKFLKEYEDYRIYDKEKIL